MQIAAMAHRIRPCFVPANIVEKELKSVAKKGARKVSLKTYWIKLHKVANKFYQEVTLMEQAFIKDAKLTVGEYTKANKATPTAFKRITLNEE